MVKICVAHAFVLLVVADMAASFIINETIAEAANRIKAVKTRRQGGRAKGKKKHKSTSSSAGRAASGDDEADSMDLSTEGITTSDDTEEKKKKARYRPRSTEERKGWRKWHRKCTPCHGDQIKKWRDPSIRWICGAFQRARRSFKSLCMMHYRNCQDGTMFTKIHDHRCVNDTQTHGDHFFYEYDVAITDDSSSDNSDGSTASENSSSESF